MRIPVAQNFQVNQYPEFADALVPCLRMHEFRLPSLRRRSEPSSYGPITIRIPALSTLAKLWGLAPEICLCVEFTPISVMGMILAKLRGQGCRSFLLIESDPRFRGSRVSRWTTAIKRLLTSLADHVVANSDAASRFAEVFLRVPSEQLIRETYLTSSPPVTPQTASVPASPPGIVRVVFLNSLTPRKGAEQLINAYGSCDARTHVNSSLHIYGDGPERDRLEALAATVRAQTSASVHFEGAVPYSEAGFVYSSADLVVAPSLQDYRSLGAIEAAACAKPAIVSARDGAAEELERSGSWVVDPLSESDLIVALETLVNDHQERSKREAIAKLHAPAHEVEACVRKFCSAVRSARDSDRMRSSLGRR